MGIFIAETAYLEASDDLERVVPSGDEVEVLVRVEIVQAVVHRPVHDPLSKSTFGFRSNFIRNPKFN